MGDRFFSSFVGVIIALACMFLLYLWAWLHVEPEPSCDTPIGRQLLASLKEKPGDWKVESQYFIAHESGAKLWIANEGYAMRFRSSDKVEQRLDRACGDEIYELVKPRRDAWNGASSKDLGW